MKEERLIDITPTWEGILPALVEMSRTTSQNARVVAMVELRRMARLADKYVEHVKKEAKHES